LTRGKGWVVVDEQLVGLGGEDLVKAFLKMGAFGGADSF